MMMPSFHMQTIFAKYVLNCGRVTYDDANIHIHIFKDNCILLRDYSIIELDP